MLLDLLRVVRETVPDEERPLMDPEPHTMAAEDERWLLDLRRIERVASWYRGSSG
jgi:hypothetical protein